MGTVHLTKTNCLPTLMYGCEIWTLTDNSLHTINVATLHGTTVFGKVLSVVGMRALNTD